MKGKGWEWKSTEYSVREEKEPSRFQAPEESLSLLTTADEEASSRGAWIRTADLCKSMACQRSLSS